MSRCRFWIFVTVLVCIACAANARTIVQGAYLTPLQPHRGAYFDSSKSGTGVMVDVSSAGFVFLTFQGFDASGAPTWYSIQGPWSPSTEAQRIDGNGIGKLDQPLLYAFGGQCITCDFTGSPTLSIAPYPVSVVWTSPRHLDLVIGNQSWHMDAVQYGMSDDQLLAGTWQLTISWDGAALTQLVTIEPGVVLGAPPVATFAVLDPGADPSIALPPPGSEYYAIASNKCTPGPVRVGTYGEAFSDIFSAVKQSTLFNYPSFDEFLAPMLWYDANLGHGGLDVVTYAMGVDTTSLVLGPNNVHFDVYVEPDRIVGHGIVQGQNLKNVPAKYWLPDSVTLNLLMQRVPDGFECHIGPVPL